MTTYNIRFKHAAKLYGLNLGLLIMGGIFIHYTIGAGSYPASPLAQHLQNSASSLLFTSCVIAPLTEELAFRLPLRGGRGNLSLGIATLGLLVLSLFTSLALQSWQALLTGLGLLITAYTIFGRWRYVSSSLARMVTKYRLPAIALGSLSASGLN